jgi:2,4-dienoyl-CoA reductase-like NADH-dependent reductase (Old Yellow Enzyme family)/thioredoxin reductase
MSERYKNLTAPMYLRGHVLKTRLIYPVAQPHFLQGDDNYPTNATISYYEARVRDDGAAMIWLQDLTDREQRTQPLDCGHFSMYDLDDKGAQNGINHFTGHMHLYGSYVCPELNLGRRMHLCCNDPAWGFVPQRGLPPGVEKPEDLIDRNGNPVPCSLDFAKTTQMSFDGPIPTEEDAEAGERVDPMGRQIYMTREVMDDYLNKMVAHAKQWKSLGADGGYLDLSWNYPIGQFLRASFNQRTDEYGGSLENRMRFPLEVLRRLRSELGESYLLSINSPAVCDQPGGDGMTLDELVVFLKAAEPYADILHLRVRGVDHIPEKGCLSADASAYLKAQGVKMPIAISTPYKDLDKMEAEIAAGRCDFIAPGHMFICNENLGKLLQEGRGEDANPCIECHCCRGTSSTGEWMSACTINPEMGIEYRKPFLVRPVTKLKKVAVIGGGPGGMKCAMYLQDRGHTPVIFEATGELGGQIKMANYATFKWELKRYLDFLKAQVAKRGIEVRLNTAATPEAVKAEGFDAVVVAVGGSAKAPKIEGVENAKWNPINIYGHESEIGHTVVVIGGASSASEAAVHLAKLGHEVIQLSRKECIGYDLNPIRSIPYMNALANKSGVLTYHSVRTQKIEPNAVTFTDQDGVQQTVACDDVVAAGGMEPNSGLAISFKSCADEFYMIGDCRENGTMRHAIRDAYGIAMQI